MIVSSRSLSVALCSGVVALGLTLWAQDAPKINFLTEENRTDVAAITHLLTPTRGIKEVKESTCEATSSAPTRSIQAASDAVAFSFDSNSAKLSPQATHTLDALGKALTSEQLKSFRFQIEGHTDNRGSDDLNCRLSRNRAQNVVIYLTKNFGIQEGRLVAKGYGKTTPIDSNDTQEGRRKNRRVQIINLGALQ